MVAPVTVGEKDLRTLLGIVSDDRADLPAEGGLPLSLLADLMGQIRCDIMAFHGLDSNLRTEWFWQSIPTGTMTIPMPGLWIRRTGSISGTASPAATPPAAAICAASRRFRISTQPGNGTASACTATFSGRWDGTIRSS